MTKKRNNTTLILWLVYLSLLAVLLPHTAWAFSQFEPEPAALPYIGRVFIVAWLAAIAFEASIAVLTHKLALHIETVPNYQNKRRKFSERYLNAYSVGLVTAVLVSALANLAHAVEFGQPMALTADSSLLFGLYVVVFGAILPFVSLLFARVLSNVADTEAEVNPELTRANTTIGELRKALREANKRAGDSEARFNAAGDLLRLVSGEKRERIIAAREFWPELPQSAIALIAGASAGYVSDTIKDIETIEVK